MATMVNTAVMSIEKKERNTDFMANAIAASLRMLPHQPRRWLQKYGNEPFNSIKRRGAIEGCEHLIEDMRECMELANSLLKK